MVGCGEGRGAGRWGVWWGVVGCGEGRGAGRWGVWWGVVRVVVLGGGGVCGGVCGGVGSSCLLFCSTMATHLQHPGEGRVPERHVGGLIQEG